MAADKPKSYSIAKAAEKLGCHKNTVAQLRRKLELGTMIEGLGWILSQSDVEKIGAIKRDGPGQPRKER